MKHLLSLIFAASFIFTEQINVLLLEYQDIYNDDIGIALTNYQNENALTDASLNIIPSEAFHSGNISTLNFESTIDAYDLDVIVFPHNLSVENWNSQSIFPPLTDFMEQGGLVIFIGNNNYSWMADHAWFSGLSAEQFQCCGMAITNEGCPNSELYNNVYTYPGCGNGNSGCASMFASPYWYQLSEQDMNDENFFKIFEHDVELCSGWTYESSNLVVGKSFGLGNLILFGDSNPNGDGSNDYNATRNLLGNIIHTYIEDDTVTDELNYALSFDGSDDWVRINNSNSINFGTGDFTVQAKIKTSNLSQNARIVAKGDSGTPGSYQVNILDGKLRTAFYNQENYSDENTLVADEWQLLTMTRENGHVKGYINLTQHISENPIWADLGNDLELAIGREPGYTSFFNGLIDDVVILQRAISTEELELSYNSGMPLNTDGIVAFYDFNQGSGDVLIDISGNGNHGVIDGASWVNIEVCTDESAYNYNEAGNCVYKNIGDYSLEFNDIYDYVDIGRPLSLEAEDNASISSWINTTENNYSNEGEGRGTFISNDTEPMNPQMQFHALSSGKVWLQGEGLGCTSEKSINDGIWHHIVGIKSGGTLSLYIDDEFQCSVCCGYDLDQGNNFFLGAHRRDGDQFAYRGLINNVKFIDRSISEDEISVLYNGGNVENTVADYRFQSPTENILIDYVGNNNGEFYGTPTWVENIEGCTDEYACNYNEEANIDDGSCSYDCYDNGDYSLSFDGLDDYVELAGGLDTQYAADDSFTYSLWIYSKESNRNQGIIQNDYNDSSNVGFALRKYGSDNTLKLSSNAFNTISGNTEIELNRWYHIVITKELSTLKIYLDGELESFSDDINMTFGVDSELLNLGVGNSDVSENFNGLMKDFIVWDRALSIDELQDTLEISYGLIADYKFNQGPEGSFSDNLIDHSGNRNHGVINGATWFENILGCTDEYACNYDEEANTDDGSCDYGDLCGECGGNNSSCEIIFDIDGNEYGSVTIGNQVWMKQNLKVANYNNGDEIPTGYSNDEWDNLSEGAYSTYDDNDLNKDIYGNLYNWWAANDDRGVCPVGWELPSESDWSSLVSYLGGQDVAGGKLKQQGLNYWNAPNENATNESGFSALPAGTRHSNGGLDYEYIGDMGNFWSTGITSETNGLNYLLNNDSGYINITGNGKGWGGSIRCLKENIEGCTDEYACNYNEAADFNDSSCDYSCVENCDCSLSFDAQDDYVEVYSNDLNQIFSGTNPFTVSVWVYGNGVDNYWSQIIGKGFTAEEDPNGSNPNTFQVFDDNGRISFILHSNAASNNPSFMRIQANIPNNQWNNLVATYDGGTDPSSLKLYNNGVLLNNVEQFNNGFYGMNSNSEPLHIGARVNQNGQSGFVWNDKISKSKIWNTVLSESEISNLYDGDYDTLNLVADWKFSSGGGDILYDHSGNQNHGTIYGATWLGGIEGCTDPLAENYNEEAILDDNSCTGGPINHSSFTFAGEFDDGYYYISKNESYANDAIQECEDSNGNLVSISSQQENDFVSSLVPGVQFWIGLTDEDSEGNFEWVDGSAYDYQNWAPTEPNNSGPNGNEDHTLINSSEGWSDPFDGFWNDVDGNYEPYLFVLEYRDIEGCTDQYACNYNEEANIDDDSCEYNNCDLIDGSFLFHGTSSVQINNFPTNYHNMTVSAKIKPNSISGSGSWDNIVDAYYQGGQTPFRLGFVDGELRFGYENGGAYWASTEYSDTEYNIVTGTREFIDGEYVLKLFINGELVDSSVTSVSPDLTQLSQLVAIGDNATGHNDENFYGFIDNVSIWNIALSDSEISESIPSLTGDEEGLIAYYNFNQSENLISDVLIDRSGNMYHGTINGATWIENTEGCTDEYACNYDEEANFDDGSCDYSCHEPGDYSLNFDGEDDYVFVDKEVLSDSFTISAWIFPDFMDDNHRAVYADYSDFLEIWFGYGFEGKLRLHVGGLDYLDSGTNVIEYDSWNHIVAIWDGSEAKIYSNGNLVASGSNGLGNPEPHTFNLGARMNNNSNYHSGYLNKIDLFNHALSEEEIQYLNNPNHIASSSSASYRFNQGSDGDYPNTLIDHSGNRHHGAINGATWIENIQGCTDPQAGNFNEQATTEDGSCEYSEAEISINELDFDILVYENLVMTESFSISNNGLADLDWEILNSPDWLDILVDSGTIESGASESISLEANSYGYECGDYSGSIEIITNDPNNLSITIPVSMNVLYPVPVFSQFILDFGDISFESESAIDFIVENQGCSDLNFSGAFENQNFSIDTDDTLTVGAGDSTSLTITFAAGIDELELLDNLILTYQNDPFNISDTIPVSASVIPDSHPIITSIVDVPEDQGGWVNLTFTRSVHDTDSLSRVESYSVEADYGNGWIISGSGNAYSNNRYTMQVHTQIDSSSTSYGLVDFRVIAGMEEGNFASEIEQGYSVDNIEPSAPDNVFSSNPEDNSIRVSWDYTPDFDFAYHHVSGIENCTNDNECNTVANQIDIPIIGSYDEYYVNSFDINGNASNASTYSSAYNLHYGANLVSFSVIPEDNTLENLIPCPGVDNVIGASEASTCLPWGQWVGSLETIEPEMGYWVEVDGEYILTVDGDKIYNTNYDLNYGANLISYTCSVEGSLDELISNELLSLTTGVIGEGDAATYIPNIGWVGSLDSFKPGRGYWLKVSAGTEMSYDCPVESTDILSRNTVEREEIKNYAQSTKQAFYFFNDIENIEIGDRIESYCNNTLVGSRIWTGPYMDVPAMGEDKQDITENYCLEGSIPTFKFIKEDSGEIFELTGNIPSWEDNQIFMLEDMVPELLTPEVYNLSNAYPNPFNPSTTIDFSVPSESFVSIDIYDITGRNIQTLVSDNYQPGYYSISWNADTYSSGVYFVKMVSGNYIESQKLMLIK